MSRGSIRARTLWVATALGLMTAAFIVTKTGRDALFFQGRGLFDLPAAYLGISFLSGPVAIGTLAAMRRLGPRAARVVVPSLMAVVVVSFGIWGSPGGGFWNTGFFILVPVVWGVMFSLAWLLLSDLLEEAPADVLGNSFATVGAGSIVGGTGGSLLVRGLAEALTPGEILLVGAGLIGVTVATLVLAQRRYPPPPVAPVEEQVPAGSTRTPSSALYRRVFRNRYASLLLSIAALGALTGVLVEFQFYLTAATRQNDGAENAQFFANFYLVLNLAALTVQLLIMPLLQRRVGVHGSLLVLPFVLVGGAATLVLLGASTVLRSGLRVTEGGLKSSIHRANWEQAFLPVDREERAAFKIVIDGMGVRTGEAIAAVALFAWLQVVVGDQSLAGQDFQWVSLSLLGAATLWAALTSRLRTTLAQTLGPGCPPDPDLRVPDS